MKNAHRQQTVYPMKRVFVLLAFVVIAAGLISWVEDDIVAVIKQRITRQMSVNARVKLDLFFNQPKYAPGDTALVRTIYVGAADLKPVGGRELVYIELHDAKGAVVLSEYFVVKDGWSSNKIAIPETLRPGIYLFVAYSDWMRNGNASLFFRRDFVVTGPNVLEKEEDLSPKPSLQFYPEGGTLVNSVTNNVIVRRTGNEKFNTVVIRTGNDEVTRATFDANGLAAVLFMPVAGTAYRAEAINGNELVKFDLPAVAKEGFALRVTPASDGNLSVRIQAVLPEARRSRRYYALLVNNDGLVFSKSLNYTGADVEEFVLSNEWKKGVGQLLVVDEDKVVLSKRTIFIDKDTGYDVKFLRLKSTYPTRQQAGVIVEVKGKNGLPVSGYVTASVVNRNIFGDSLDRFDPFDNLMLYSDVSSTFRLRYPADHDGLLRYLCTQDCPWLKWNEIISGKIKDPVIVPKTHVILDGKVLVAGTQQPVPDLTDVTFFFSKQMMGYERKIEQNGLFKFPLLFDFTGIEDVIYVASRNGKDVPPVSVLRSPPDTTYYFKASESHESSTPDLYGTYSDLKRSIDKSFLFFTKLKNLTDSSTDLNHFIEAELGTPDVVFRTQDYILFPTMVDLVREVLKAVDYRIVRGKGVVRVYTSNKLPTFDATPLFVIDGVMTKEASAFMNLVPSEIITIKIIRDAAKLKAWRALGANGIILVRTTQPERNRALVRPDYSFPVTGSSLVHTGDDVSWKFRTETSPDLRASLNWNANVLLDASGRAVLRFRTPDDATRFIIHVEGMTLDGIPFSKRDGFSVQYNLQP